MDTHYQDQGRTLAEKHLEDNVITKEEFTELKTTMKGFGNAGDASRFYLGYLRHVRTVLPNMDTTKTLTPRLLQKQYKVYKKARKAARKERRAEKRRAREAKGVKQEIKQEGASPRSAPPPDRQALL